VQEWIDNHLRHKKDKTKSLGHNVVKDVVNFCAQTFDTAKEMGLAKGDNPFRSAKLRLPAKKNKRKKNLLRTSIVKEPDDMEQEKRQNPFTEDEIRAFHQEPDPENMMYVWGALGMALGERPSEGCALTMATSGSTQTPQKSESKSPSSSIVRPRTTRTR
jgi:integrase